MKEQDLQAKIIKFLKSNGFDVFKTIRCNRNGIADIIACAPDGKFWAIEVKVGSNKPSALQTYYIEEVCKRGGIGFVTWDLQTVIDLVSSHYPESKT